MPGLLIALTCSCLFAPTSWAARRQALDVDAIDENVRAIKGWAEELMGSEDLVDATLRLHAETTEKKERSFLTHAEHGPKSKCGSFVEQREGFCKNSRYEMEQYMRKTRLATTGHLAIARMKTTHDVRRQCWLQYQEAPTQAEAEQRALSCCEENRDVNNTKECVLVGPTVTSSVSDHCKFRLGEKPWFEDSCRCPSDRPHLFKDGSTIIRQTGGDSVSFGPHDNAVCVDECFANSFEQTSTGAAPRSSKEWPVVFLAVYKLGGPIVHSNLAFCPPGAILDGGAECMNPNADAKECWSTFSTDHHTSVFKEGIDVPKFLMKHGCRELIFDGNYGGGTWSPRTYETGCWAQGRDSQPFWWSQGSRTGLGYQRLYWLTSENKFAPFKDSDGGWGRSSTTHSVEAEVQQCFSSGPTGQRLDFNPGTYSLLHHNCNKFSTEAMRYMGLPKYYDSADKGRHSAIAFSATREESFWRRHLAAPTSLIFGHDRSQVSAQCTREFFGAELNCRRVSSSGRKGDCPDDPEENSLRCYDPSQVGNNGKDGIAPAVDYQGSVNGKCAVSIGENCSKSGPAQCQPGAACMDGTCRTR